MQGLHNQQQQLAALLSAALPKKHEHSKPSPAAAAAATTSSPAASDSTLTSSSDEEESSRVAALSSLHRAVIYPPNSILVTHSASFLVQGLSDLLSDKSYLVRQSAATAYGALCSVLCSVPIATNGRQNHVVLGGFVDRFLGWALPLLSHIGTGTAELALESLKEFLNVGDVGALERYAFPILKSCQDLLEDERTSPTLLRRLLGVLTLIAIKFFRCFQPRFVDIVDLLLGWAMVPGIAESDWRVIMDSFLQFRKHWANNMQFSLGLLSKFLGDIDVLLQDGSPDTQQHFQRLIALLSCFSTVLQSVASGLLEIYMLEQISEPLCKMVPCLLGSLSTIGKKFGWSKWIEDSWRCLTLLAEILGERFSIFYPAAADILFQSLEMENVVQNIGNRRVNPFQVHGVLKTNLQILSLQNHGLLPSSVQKILQFGGTISTLRLHPNHLVTGSAAATYAFLLQHINHEVVEKTLDSLLSELELLKNVLYNSCIKGSMADMITAPNSCTECELLALIQFDLKVVLICVSMASSDKMTGKLKSDALFLTRLKKLAYFVIEKFHPFAIPAQHFVELQVIVLKTLERLTEIELLSNCPTGKVTTGNTIAGTTDETTSKEELSMVICGFLKKYSPLLVKSLDSSSPLAVKLEALQWIHKFCGNLITIYENLKVTPWPCDVSGFVEIMQDLLFSVLDAASDKEPKVRSLVALVLDLLLQAKLINATHFPYVAGVVLDRLGDPESTIRSAFIRLLSYILPITVYMYGLCDYYMDTARSIGAAGHNSGTNWKWKQVFALKQLPQQLRSQQLVSILSYLSQRWKAPLSSWIQRLICMCQSTASLQPEDSGFMDANALWWNIKVEEDILGRICSVNILAGAWWAINEAARYCIFTRLRTNLGGPTQTFAALERMLLDIAHVLQLDTEESDGNLNIISSSYAHLLPMRLLVDFVEALKKNVYNAYEGSVVLPRPTRQSSLFFRSNKKVCEEWFSRISEPMMRAGLALQYHSATIHYCAVRLQDITNLVSSTVSDKYRAQNNETMQSSVERFAVEIFRVVRQMALALCRNHEPEALIGLQKWATTTFSPMLLEESSCSDKEILQKFSWMTGLVYAAEGQYEKAAAHFIHLMQTEDSLSSMGSDGVQFAIARIIESYTAISDWKSLESWLLELQTLRSKHAGKSYSGALTTAGNDINSIQALARFDEGDLQASWACLDLTPKSSSELTLDPKSALQRSEQMFLQAMLFHREGKGDKVSYELQKSKSLLEESLSVLPLDGLLEAAPQINHLYCIRAFEENHEHVGSQDKCLLPLLGSYVQASDTRINQGHQDCSSWLKVLRVFQTTQPTSPTTLKLSNKLLSLARKQRNLLLANRLSSYIEVHAAKCPGKDVRDYLISSLQYEGILMMRSNRDKKEDALINLWSFLSPLMISTSLVVSDSFDNIIKAKACLKLSNWLQQAYLDMRFGDIVARIKADFSITDSFSPSGWLAFLSADNLIAEPCISVVVEGIVGTATKLSTCLCPAMGKSWISYATWCYSRGIKHLSANREPPISNCSYPPALVTEILPQNLRLTEEELLKVKDIVLQLLKEGSCSEAHYDFAKGSDVSSEVLRPENHLQPLLEQIIDIIETTAGAAEAEDNTCEGLSSTLMSQLRRCIACANVTVEDQTESLYIGDLLNIWWSLRRRRVYLFGHAAQAFINYLSYSSFNCSEGQLTGLSSGSMNKSASYSLRATLYVLKILLNYGVELKDTLEPALSTIPLIPWQGIIPQLFARVSTHPEQIIRQLLEGLLLMLAKVAPWSIVYPTLVDANTHENEPSGELQRILACLNKSYPILVKDAQLMIKELENVSVLWEELWLSTLQDLHADVVRRINLLKEEAARTAENVSLSHGEKNKINAAKYSAMMAPVIVVLERRLVSTSRKPETSHEMQFHREFGDQIRSAILNFKTPPVSAATLGDVWRPFESIAASLSSYQRKSSVCLGEVAPQLSQLSSSEAPMPGLEKYTTLPDLDGSPADTNSGVVTIASFSEQITIVSTKTRPKKLVLLGSDGQKYTYLLKGREDLRLDARIMQLLKAINGFLLSTSATGIQPLGVRYYSVTPISGRAGLIQWVDNVTSIYSVFKSWQNRVQQTSLSGSSVGNAKQAFPPPVPRPIDMFYSKIIPALKEKGIRRVISRRDWPQEVKRKVLLDLMKEAPKQLLHQELWCASEGFKAFRSKLKRYSGSLAAMSIIGHILGLGDRHLDNILIDFCSGDILHIDYNVCFDKGQRLKVPEIVPFRLTQTIEAALGLTGIEGSFRSNCEAVFGVLKKNKDIILMLLEAFVWDPLVEWTRGDFHDDAAIVGEERKGMELAVSLSLFASRVQEIRVPLQEHHDLLLATLPAIEDALEGFVNILNRYEVVSAAYHRAEQERANLLLHESSAKSNVAETASSSEKIRASLEMQAREFTQALTMVREKAQEATSWMEQHGRIIDALRNSSVPEIKGWSWQTGAEESLSLTSAVLLAGVPLTVVPEPTQVQCSDIDREVSKSMGDLYRGLSSAVSSLQTYSLALQQVLPADYLTTSPVHAWAQVLQLSVNTVSSDLLSLARRKAAELISQGHMDRFNLVQSRYDELSVTVSKYAGKIKGMEEEHAELLNSIGPEDESKAKHRLLSAFLKYMCFYDLLRKEDTTALESQEAGMPEVVKLQEIEMKKANFLRVLCSATVNLYGDVKHMIRNCVNHSCEGIPDSRPQSEHGYIFDEIEGQIEKCLLITDFLNELGQYIEGDILKVTVDGDCERCLFQENWASNFHNCLSCCKRFVQHMTEVALPEVISCLISSSSEVMDVFGSLSHIRGSIDTALEQLIEVELERAYLAEFEQNYFLKVGQITEQQLALEEAAVKGRDHLSWEEAEELASQEEACREQLDKLHQTWNQKDLRTTTLLQKEANIARALVASENSLQSLVSTEEHGESHVSRGKALLSLLMQPFSELESADTALMLSDRPMESTTRGISHIGDLVNSGCPTSEYIWKFPAILPSHAFFVWKVSLMDLFLDFCTNNTSSFVDKNLGLDHLVHALSRKLEDRLQYYIKQYLKERVAPVLLARLDKDIEYLKHVTELKEFPFDPKRDLGEIKRVQLMFEEYCNAHETARAARSATSLMKRQINDLKDGLRKTILDVIRMEWMNDTKLNPLQNNRLVGNEFLMLDDTSLPSILNINRRKVLECMQTSIVQITRSLDILQDCEKNSVTAEGQLERAMVWACGGPSTSGGGNNVVRSAGIPPEFHDHLTRRKQLLWETREKASEMMKICISVLKFEASRDGIYLNSEEFHPSRSGGDSTVWQQTYLNILTKLDVSYHSFTRSEQEWRLTQHNMEAASSGLNSASGELHIASDKVKTASGNLQSTLLAMRDCAYEASVALNAFAGIIKGHTALTSECGSMLEEVLAITEGLHDVHSLGKEAAALHFALMEDLSKVNAILLPLDSMLSKDVTAMTSAMTNEQETKMEISPIHGLAIFQSYYVRMKEACQAFKPFVPSLTSSVMGLYSILTRLARTASVHAGNLHKALEGLGEIQEERSQGNDLTRSDMPAPEMVYDDGESDIFIKPDGENEEHLDICALSLEEEEWISPPESIMSCSSDSSVTSVEARLTDGSNNSILTDLRLNEDDDGSEVQEDVLPAMKTCDDLQTQTSSRNMQECTVEKSVHSNESSYSNQDRDEDGSTLEISQIQTESAPRTARGKNAHAMSILKRIEMKLDGLDTNRDMNISEQVDFLLKQATSVDNLCNMYEGWTPWI